MKIELALRPSLALRLPLALWLLLAFAAPPAASAEDGPPAGVRFGESALPGARLEKRTDHPPETVRMISERTGVPVVRFSMDAVTLRGLRAQVNYVDCGSPADAERARAALHALTKGTSPALGVAGSTVVEVVKCGRPLATRILAAIGGLPERPTAWEVRFRAACVAPLEFGLAYERANDVYAAVLGEKAGADPAPLDARIRALTKGFRPASALTLYVGPRPWFHGSLASVPTPTAVERHGGYSLLSFGTLPERAGLRYVEVSGVVTVSPAFPRAPGQSPPTAGKGAPAEARRDAPIDAALTRATDRWPATATAMIALAQSLTAGLAGDVARADAILAHVYAAVRYGGPAGARIGVEAALAQGSGRCWDQCDIFVTLCRAAGIPARQVAGWAPTLGGGHVWAEVYLGDAGWIPADATTPWLGAGDDYVPFYGTDDGEMSVVYLSVPVLRRKE